MEDDATPDPGAPMASAPARERLSEFRSRFRPRQDIPDNVPTACLLQGDRDPEVLKSPEFLRHDVVHVMFEYNEQVRVATAIEVARYVEERQPWEDYDLCICNPALTWCIGVTHNEDVIVVGRREICDGGAGEQPAAIVEVVDDNEPT